MDDHLHPDAGTIKRLGSPFKVDGFQRAGPPAGSRHAPSLSESFAGSSIATQERVAGQALNSTTLPYDPTEEGITDAERIRRQILNMPFTRKESWVGYASTPKLQIYQHITLILDISNHCDNNSHPTLLRCINLNDFYTLACLWHRFNDRDDMIRRFGSRLLDHKKKNCIFWLWSKAFRLWCPLRFWSAPETLHHCCSDTGRILSSNSTAKSGRMMSVDGRSTTLLVGFEE